MTIKPVGYCFLNPLKNKGNAPGFSGTVTISADALNEAYLPSVADDLALGIAEQLTLFGQNVLIRIIGETPGERILGFASSYDSPVREFLKGLPKQPHLKFIFHSG